MTTINRRALLGGAALTALAAPAAVADDPVRARGPVILTVSGALTNPNRGGVDPDTDKFFGYNEDEFDKAAEFDFEALEALDTVKVRADFPKSGPVYEYEGPMLSDVLKAAGAEGATVTLRALDGYAVEVPMQELIDMGAVLALRRNGESFRIGGFGPTHVVFPRADDDRLADMSDDNWIWSVYHIKVQ